VRTRSSRARTGTALGLAVLLGFLVTSCGSSGKNSSGPKVISAGQLDVQLPQGSGSSGASGANTSDTSDTIPLAQEDPTTKLFTAFNTFQSCLKGLGVKFIGAPNQSDPNSPTNDPTYIKNLSTCAAKSNILQALKDAQSYQDNLTPAQIEQQNKGYLAWRDCMIGRGWGIPEPKPDAKGRLFSFGAGANGQGPNFVPPPGQDILTSSDIRECASEAQKKVPQNSGG
jgi:hypothetical protein